MIFLFLSILCTASVYIIFRIFPKYGIDSLAAICVNYLVCALMGLLFIDTNIFQYIRNAPAGEIGLVIITGVSFLLVFNLMSLTTLLLGVSGSTIISRMSMVIPAAMSIIWFAEHIGWMKGLGILMALPAIYFSVFQKNGSKPIQHNIPIRNNLLKAAIPILAFVGVGITDTELKLAQVWYLKSSPGKEYMTILFFCACLAGLLITTTKQGGIRKLISSKNLIAGLLLGLVNFFSLYFFFQALGSGIEGSRLFPINSVGIVSIGSVIAILFLKEHVNARKIAGLLLAILAIVLISI